MDKCPVCGKPLRECEEIVAVFGLLFCSDECGHQYYADYPEDYEDSKEYVNPEDIGVC